MVRAFDHLQIVLDDEQRITLRHQPVEDADQHRHVVEMQPGRRLVENQQAVLVLLIREPLDELQPLRLAATQDIQRLAEREVAQPHLLQHHQRLHHFLFAHLGEKADRLRDRQLQHVVDGFPREPDFQHMRLVAPPLALRAADEDIAQELHLDFLEAIAPAALAASHARVEGKRARRQPLRDRVRRLGEKIADAVEDAEIHRRRRARRARERRLIHHHHLLDLVRTEQLLQRARRLVGRQVFRREQISVKHVVNERALPRAGHACDARENAERKLHVDPLEIVLPRALHRDGAARLPPLRRHRDGLRPCEIVRREGRRGFPREQRAERPAENQLPTRRPAPWPDLHEIVRRADDRLVVLDHEQCVPFVAELLHHADQPARVARVQPDARLIQHEQRVHQRRAEARRQIHPLHLPAAQRPRRPVQREIAEPHLVEVAEPRADLVRQHLRRRVAAPLSIGR